MAKVTAPLLSLGASGAVGGAMVFSTWKGRPYVRQLVSPSNPRSAKQQSVRAMFKFLSKAWAALSGTNKDSWDGLANSDAVSDFNAYMRINQKRWTQFQTPGIQYPIGNTGTSQVIGTFAATGGVGQITLSVPITTVNQGWGVLLFRSPTGTFTPSFSNMIGAIVANTVATFTFVDTPLAPGTYFYDAKAFTTDGVIGADKGEISGVAT